jgi:hypothetical protein
METSGKRRNTDPREAAGNSNGQGGYEDSGLVPEGGGPELVRADREKGCRAHEGCVSVAST